MEMKCALTSASFAFVFLVLAAALGSSPVFAAGTTRLQCDAAGAGDISMRARFEQRASGRRKFNTEFEAAPGGNFTAGQRMTVLVADVKAGAVKLKKIVGGDIAGELQLDDAAGPGDNEKPFPPDFPTVQRNTPVLIKVGGQNVLSCRLQ
jgi:hypothetical protein